MFPVISLVLTQPFPHDGSSADLGLCLPGHVASMGLVMLDDICSWQHRTQTRKPKSGSRLVHTDLGIFGLFFPPFYRG